MKGVFLQIKQSSAHFRQTRHRTTKTPHNHLSYTYLDNHCHSFPDAHTQRNQDLAVFWLILRRFPSQLRSAYSSCGVCSPRAFSSIQYSSLFLCVYYNANSQAERQKPYHAGIFFCRPTSVWGVTGRRRCSS